MTSLGQNTGNTRQLLAFLYQQPSVRANVVADHLDVTYATAMILIRDVEDLGILEETTGRQRNRRYLFAECVNLFT